MNNGYLELVSRFSSGIRGALLALPLSLQEEVSEIRITQNAPISLSLQGRLFFLDQKGSLQQRPSDFAYFPTEEEMEESLLSLCDYALHRHMEEIGQGFVTLDSGHRIGIGGMVLGDGHRVVRVNSFVARVARQIRCKGTMELAALLQDKPVGILIASTPSSGKTTLLADLALEMAQRYAVAVIDQRMELSPKLKNAPLALCSGMEKGEGILLAVRSLAPQLIFCDELGGEKEIAAVAWAMQCGVPLIATIHCDTLQQLEYRHKGLLLSGGFSYVVFLKGSFAPGEVREVITLGQNGGDADDFAVQRSGGQLAKRSSKTTFTLY